MEMEETQHQALGSDDELTLAPEYDAHPLDASFNQRRLAGWRGVRRGKDGLVLVAQRQVQHAIEPRAQPQLLELAGRRGCRLHPACRIASLSTSAPRGRPATPTAARAG